MVIDMKDIPLYKQIQEAIKKQIMLGNLRPGDRIPSEKELADQFHVSLMTTKGALSGLAEEGIVVRSKGKGTFVAGQAPYHLKFQKEDSSKNTSALLPRKKLIGMIIPSMRTKVEQRLLDAIENTVNEYGYTLVIRVSRGCPMKERQSIQDLDELGISGLVLFSIGANHERQAVDQAEELGCPVVLIDRYYTDKPFVSVSSDNRDGARKAVTYLAKLGHRKLAILSPPIEHSVMADRLAGFENAITYLPETSVLRYTMPYESFNVSRDEGAKLMNGWIAEHHAHFSGVIATDVELARLAYYALKRYGSLTGKHLITFDDPEIPDIAYIRQDESSIGRKAVSLLMEHIVRGEERQGQFVVPVQLMWPQ
ncbi:GntR family transcriptional regulator [Paenibacillus glycanilyticus]|uniref:Transcriptional regulator n=1 Tax=Paenibacillus glycanilyticus TaxID=126569 RepID=A0ABQ6G737_9BACL|nr:GntR family transcriptional regulator [Paenibacillus glycanilyticus]GLX65815.1 transcriptional regulator [Paenibacillus glycanilyticus]